jgi:hypothetical protein
MWQALGDYSNSCSGVKPEVKRRPRKLRCRWMDKIKAILEKTELEVADPVSLAKYGD